jgi:hypothetical protein
MRSKTIDLPLNKRKPGIGIVESRLVVQLLSCWGDCGTVKLCCYFHAHDFEQHADPPTVVQMRETTKRLREWSRQDAHFLADLETAIATNGPIALA